MQKEIVKAFEAKGIKITQGTVSKAIKAARMEWKENRLEDMDKIMERELAKLDKMEEDSADLFDTFNPNATDLEIFSASKEAAEWVKARLKIMEQRHKLLGLYKPVKLDIESKNENVNVNAEQSDEIRREILRRLSPKY